MIKVSKPLAFSLLLFFLVLSVLFFMLEAKENNRSYAVLKFVSTMGMVVSAIIYGKAKKADKADD